MALYWPRQKVAFDIVDDPCSTPVEEGAFDGLAVIPVTREQMGDTRTMDRIVRILREAGTAGCGEDGGAMRRTQRRISRILAR